MATGKSSQQVHPSSSSSPTSDSLLCGYQIHEIKKADSKWKCIYCDRIIKQAMQLTECGHRCCKGCYESRAAAVAIGEKMTCPVRECNTQFEKSEVRTIFMTIKYCVHKLCIFYFKDNG